MPKTKRAFSFLYYKCNMILILYLFFFLLLNPLGRFLKTPNASSSSFHHNVNTTLNSWGKKRYARKWSGGTTRTPFWVQGDTSLDAQLRGTRDLSWGWGNRGYGFLLTEATKQASSVHVAFRDAVCGIRLPPIIFSRGISQVPWVPNLIVSCG